MGCDIHLYAEKKNADGTWENIPLPMKSEYFPRSYALFGWLAGVRNYSAMTPLAERRGVPDDASEFVKEELEFWKGDAHSASWYSVEELLAFDYEAPFEDLRVTRQTGPNSWNGGCTGEPGEGEITTYRERFPGEFFEIIEALRSGGEYRLVFWFDN